MLTLLFPCLRRALCSLLGVVVVTGATGAERPNVILIFADDLGPGLLGSYGQQLIKTPHLDKLAAEGMQFQNYYGGVYCAPARWTLLTGMHDGRLGGWGQTRGGLLIQRDAGKITEQKYLRKFEEMRKRAAPIAENEVFLAQVAQRAGYRTAQFGKLDRGFVTWHEQVKRYGWDFYEGYYDHVRCHGFYPAYLWRNGERFDLPGNTSPYCGKRDERGSEPVGEGERPIPRTSSLQGF